METYRVIKDSYGRYVVQWSEDGETWQGWYDPMYGCPRYKHLTLFFAKRRVDRLVKEQERRLAVEAYVPKVVYGPYP